MQDHRGVLPAREKQHRTFGLGDGLPDYVDRLGLKGLKMIRNCAGHDERLKEIVTIGLLGR